MKAILYFILFLFIGIGSTLITVRDVVTNRYFNDSKNIKSLKNPKKYMSIDTLKINEIYDNDVSSSRGIGRILIGNLVSDNSSLSIAVTSEKYIDYSLKQVLYKSKLTGDFFLKNAPKRYYRGEIMSLYTFIVLKILFIFIIIFLIYKLIKYQQNKIYRL